MPDQNASTGLHTSITNITATESSVVKTQIAEGSIGELGELAIIDGTVFETIPRTIQELGFEGELSFAVPDISGLADIGVASFGSPPMKETIIGTDERIQVTETGIFPWCAMASLLITAADNSQWVGTAWFIDKRTLITAGHCVYIKGSGDPKRDGWVKKIQIMPGRNGNSLPFGGITATEFCSVKGWGEKGMEEYDYGAIILPAPFQQDLGRFSYGVFLDEELREATANVAGYPIDKDKGTLWYDSRKVASLKPGKVFYEADTQGGQSGCSVYIIKDKKRIAVAVHAYGGMTSNSGTRISSEVFNNFESWKRN
jgi:glutamyl endopeptidase